MTTQWVKTKHGQYHMGQPYQSTDYGQTWFRMDDYFSNLDGLTYTERWFAAGPDDYSEHARHDYGTDAGNIRYDANCAACYLNHGHTVAYHNMQIAGGVI
jgi:hypothetical protein